MKILIIRMYPSKININSYNVQEIGLAKALIRKGNQCDIVFYNGNDESWIQEIKFDIDKSLKIYWIKSKKILSNAIYDKKIYQLAKEYDIIQTEEYEQIGNLELYKKVKKPIVIYHGPYRSKFNKKYMLRSKICDMMYKKRLLRYNPCIITKSYLATQYMKEKGFKRIYTIGVGLDSQKFSDNMSDEETKNIITEIYGKKVLLYIGEISKRRNVDFIIKIFNKLKKSRNDIKLVIIGKGEKKYLKKCKNIINKYNLSKDIIYKERINQNNLKNVYENTSIFLLPTSYDIFGMVLLEAMYFGTPTITTYNGGSSTIIKNNINGYIIKELNIEKWCNKINDILDKNKGSVSDNARLAICDYMWDELASKFIKIYEDNIQEGSE